MTEVGERLVDAVNAITGVHPGYRAAHARGVAGCRTRGAPRRDRTPDGPEGREGKQPRRVGS
jgi:hypothetical protein